MQHFARNCWPIAVPEKELLTVTCKICSQYVLDMNVYDSSPASCLATWRPFFLETYRVPPGLVLHFYPWTRV